MFAAYRCWASLVSQLESRNLLSARARIPVSDKKKKKRFLRSPLFFFFFCLCATSIPSTAFDNCAPLAAYNNNNSQTNKCCCWPLLLSECRGALGITDEQQGRMECAHTGSSSSIFSRLPVEPGHGIPL